jgi:hypothetical protein
VDPQDDIGRRVLRGQRGQLRGQQHPVVVVQRSVQDQDALMQQLMPHAVVKHRGLRLLCHAATLRHWSPLEQATLLWADPLTAQPPGPADLFQQACPQTHTTSRRATSKPCAAPAACATPYPHFPLSGTEPGAVPTGVGTPCRQ